MDIISAAEFKKMSTKKRKRKVPMGAALRIQLEQQMGRVGFALHQLMSRAKLKWNWTLEPEQLFSVQIADRLRALTLQWYESGGVAGCRALWFHVPNEGVRHVITQIILRAMGMLAGAPDFVFLWQGGCGIIEIKAGDNGLDEHQVYFKTWAHAFEIPWAIHRNSGAEKTPVDEVIATLIKWGAVIPEIPLHSAGDITTTEGDVQHG